jgi:hypothetical protein
MPRPIPENDLPPKLSAPAQRALADAGIHSLADAARRTRAEIACLHGVGPNTLKQLQAAFDVAGLSFANSDAGND